MAEPPRLDRIHRRLARLRMATLLPALPAVAGCEIVGVACTGEFVPSLTVAAIDSLTGAPVPDPLIWVRDGEFVDMLETSDGRAWGPGERPGRYAVFVEKEGYERWITLGVDVNEDACHVITVDLVARLQRES